MNSSRPPVFFSYAFRVFFLAAGLYAALSLALWIAGFHGLRWPGAPHSLTPLWHAHEMALGFGGAVVAGFLLTAVATWTGRPPVRGGWLMALALAWLGGRLAGNFSAVLDPALLAAADLAFPLLLASLATREIVLGNSRRNYGIAAITWSLAALTGVYHLGRAGFLEGGEALANALAVHVLALLIAVIAGRVVPLFTGNWLRMRGETRLPAPRPNVDKAGIALVAAAGVADTAMPGSAAAGILCVLAGAVSLWRLSAWRGTLTLANPLLWVLHLAFAGLATGYLLIGAAALGLPLSRSAALHMLTVGGIGGTILAMTTRVALGHTGRPLAAPRPIVIAYVLVALAAVLRSLGPAVPALYTMAIDVSALLWIVAFLLFLRVYTPILTGPRADQQG